MAFFSRASAASILPINNRFSKLNSSNLNVCWKCHFYLQPMRLISLKDDTNNVNMKNPSKYHLFEHVIRERNLQASRSILVRVSSFQSNVDLYNYCSSFAPVLGMHHFNEDEKDYFLVEFNHSKAVNHVLNDSSFLENVIPVKSNLVWFRKGNNKLKNFNKTSVPIIIKNGTNIPNDSFIVSQLNLQQTVSGQMQYLHQISKLNDLEKRIRFLIAHQIKASLSGIFQDAYIQPFGSSINEFGKRTCDLDLVLDLNGNVKNKEDSRFIFYTKVSKDCRVQVQECLQTISDIMKHFLPSMKNIRRILHARVPIIQFQHTLTNIDCDLSMTNMTALHMSELLYIFGEIDLRVRPLVFTIRKWAEAQNLTKHLTPSARITNFSLTLLVLFYLQRKNVLPGLNELQKLAEKSDVTYADEYVNCTFLRDISKLSAYQMRVYNSKQISPEELLIGFFQYYASFDFYNNGISLNSCSVINKPDSSPMYISNPLERNLNVSKNVNLQEVLRIQTLCREALQKLQINQKNKAWGLLAIFNINKNLTRSMDIKNLFSEDNQENESEAGAL